MSQLQHPYCVSRKVAVGERSSRSEHVGLLGCRPEVSTSCSAIDGTRTHILLLDRELLQPIELRRQEVLQNLCALGHLHGADVHKISKASGDTRNRTENTGVRAQHVSCYAISPSF